MKDIHAHLGGLAAKLACIGAASCVGANGAGQAVAQAGRGGDPHANFAATAPARPERASSMQSVTYEDAVTQRRFVLDRSSGEPLLQFQNDPNFGSEVLALRATSAQRGDDFLRSDTGRLMLRVTENGNVISFLPGSEGGAPAAIAGMGAPLNAPPMSGSLVERINQTSKQLSALAGHDVTVFGAGEFSADEAWVSDALAVTVLGVKRANASSPGVAARLHSVRVAHARGPDTKFDSGELFVGVNPGARYAGRPSSEAVARVLTGR